MEERELIQVNLRFPAAALEGLSRLADSLRALAEAAGGGAPPAAPSSEERAQSGNFDWDRFRALAEGPEPPRAAEAYLSDQAEAPAHRAAIRSQPDAPASAGPSPADAAPEAAGQERREPLEEAAPDTPDTPERREPQGTEQADPPAVRTEEAAPLEDAPAVRAEAETPLPQPESAPREAETGAEAASVRAETGSAPLPPTAAGFSVGPAGGMDPGRWTGVTEELVSAGPAPLTAEAVSQAFQRDGRRYDNGFPLY